MKKHEREKRNKIILASITIFLMVSSILSILGSSYNKRNSEYSFNDIKFKQIEDSKYGKVWIADINDQEYRFNYHPTQVQMYESNISLDPILNASKVYMSYPNPKEAGQDYNYITFAGYELANFLMLQGKNVIYGLINNKGYDIPKINCLNATEENPVIIFERYNKTMITKNGFCYKLYSSSQFDFFAVKDLLMYKMLGIIDNKNS